MTQIAVLGEALMDCLAQPDGQLRPLQGGSPYNMARAAALQGAQVTYLNALSTDVFGQGLAAQLQADGVQVRGARSALPTALAVVQLHAGQPSYGFYREGIADRDHTVHDMTAWLAAQAAPGILHTGSLHLIPPEAGKVLAIVQAAKAAGWRISADINLRPSVAPDVPAYVAAVRSIMACADWLKASDEDLHTLGHAGAQRQHAPALVALLRQQYPQLSRVALTFGAQGAHLWANGHEAHADVPPVAVQDSVGAGDTFWGCAVAHWALSAHDLPQPTQSDVAHTLAQAMAAAAINCTRQGCQPPTRAQTAAFVAQRA